VSRKVLSPKTKLIGAYRAARLCASPRLRA
jgi:hypothetical protein